MASKTTNVSNYVSVGVFQRPSAKGGLSQSFPKIFHAAFLHFINYTFGMYSQYYATKSSYSNNSHRNIAVFVYV